MNDLFQRGRVPELQHCSVGQEAIGVGACYGLRREDVIIPSLRSRAAFLVKGVPSKILMAAAFGKDTKQCGGKNTSHHLGDLSLGIIAGTGIVGGSIPLAVGAALACKLKKTGLVTLSFFGDGATNTGNFHESINLAAVLRLPIIFICENNQYAMGTSVKHSVLVENIAERAVSYGIPGVVVNGNDVITVYDAVQNAIQKAKGVSPQPTLIECKTYRWYGHSQRDPADGSYRTKEEIEAWKLKCPIKQFREYLRGEGILSEEHIREIDNEMRLEIEEAVKFAEEAPYPEPSKALDDNYAPVLEAQS
jgi:TPP-dependent pyruvate/acetoin dehydrogenase alpha subunit